MVYLFRIFLFLLATALLVACASSPHNSNNLEQLTVTHTIPQLQEKMSAGELTAVDLTHFYLQKIEQQDKQFNSVIAVNPDTLSIASRLDEERKAGKVRSPLHGIPILLKDNIETRDMPTTAGSLALAENHTLRDATVTAKLRAAGAIIIGKANLSEWANFRSERSSSGWSALGGQTRNPHDPARTACGSSSGSGAAIAANLAVAAIGTETNGSITCPASMTGIVGIKPTVGLASRSGIIPISHTQDTAGPMAKSVIDAAILLQYMSSADDNDSSTLAPVFDRTLALAPASEPRPVSALQLGVLNSAATDHEAVAELDQLLIEALRNQQTSLITDLSHSPYDGFWSDAYSVLLYEFKHTINQYFAGLPNQYQDLTLARLIEFNRQYRDQEMPYFQQEIFVNAEEKGPLSSEEYIRALENIRNETTTSLDKLLHDQELDALIGITRGPAWSIDLINGDHYGGGLSTYPAVSGYPHITIPLGTVHGLPIGLSIIGPKGQDKALIEVALVLERLIKQHEHEWGLRAGKF